MSDRYEFIEDLGRGGLGFVYRARDSVLDRDVAIKRVVIDSDEPPEELTAGLIQEAKTLSALKHPHIVTIHDVGQDREGPYIVMELLEGKTLDVIVERGALPVGDFEQLAVQTLEGLIAAQSAGLVHRDLKPTNLMLVFLPSKTFQVKILDFGLAKFSRQPATQTVDHGDAILGSIYFMAPEQFERQPVDARTDLYSAGAIFYYTLTGRYPFQGDNAVDIMNAHIRHRFEPLKQLRPDVPDSICEWVENLMARKMEDRPANAQEALDAWNPKPVVDEEQLREVASNDAAVAAELLAGFADETAGLIDDLNRALDGAQAETAEEIARTIRGTASTLGYAEIISIAEEIEEKARDDPEWGRILSGRFPDAIARLEDTLGKMPWPG